MLSAKGPDGGTLFRHDFHPLTLAIWTVLDGSQIYRPQFQRHRGNRIRVRFPSPAPFPLKTKSSSIRNCCQPQIHVVEYICRREFLEVRVTLLTKTITACLMARS